MNKINKLIIIIVFLLIWLGIPHYLATTYEMPEFYYLMILTWFPGSFIAFYLREYLK